MQKIVLKRATVFSLLLLFVFMFASELYSQNVAVTDDDSYTADPSAMLDVKSTTKGILIPRVTSVQRTAISGPQTGLIVFDTDVKVFFYWDGYPG